MYTAGRRGTSACFMPLLYVGARARVHGLAYLLEPWIARTYYASAEAGRGVLPGHGPVRAVARDNLIHYA